MGKFAYAVPPLPSNPTILICIGLTLLMGWVNSPDLFCSALETVADNSNGYALDPSSAFALYPPTAGAYKTADDQTSPPPPLGRLQYIDVYIDELLCPTQGDPTQQQQVSNLTIHALKEIFHPCWMR